MGQKLLKLTLGLGLFFTFQQGFSQEICDNGIDDDADGLIDMNDDECECFGITGSSGAISNLIPNPSFEDNTCCPTGPSSLNCAEDWIQASSATSDYLNQCDNSWWSTYWTGPQLPTPDGTMNVAGFISQPGYNEFIGTCLNSPMLAGQTYTINLDLAWEAGNTDITLSIYGTPTCTDLPWSGNLCPVGSGSWVLLDDQTIILPTTGAWQTVTFNYTPSVDMNAIAIGGPCGGTPLDPSDLMNYYFIDGLSAADSASTGITETGSYCAGDLLLTADIDTVGGTWQWYQDGIAIAGETSAAFNIMGFPAGTYTAVYALGGECSSLDYVFSLGNIPSADFTFNPVCFPSAMDFTDNSSVTGGTITGWEWDFGDGNTSSSQNPSNTYGSAGSYNVELIVTTNDGCTDTITIPVNVSTAPPADFEFEINGQSSATGLTGGCIISEVQFFDETIVTPPDFISSWSWDFGDASTSTDQDPGHYYAAAGTYTVTLTITTDAGCSSSFQMDIIMTTSPIVTPVFNDPTCYLFSDGSISLNVTGGSGSETFLIEDAAGNTINIGGSNAANNLPSGWYYYVVDALTGCIAIDSVELFNPAELDVLLEIHDPLCYGDLTGYVEIDTVYNTQGDYNNVSFFWNPNPSGVGGVWADSAWAMGVGDYVLTINDDFGCSNTFDFTINQPDELVFEEFGMESAYCRQFYYQNGNGVVYASASGGTPLGYTYEWVNLTTGATTNNTTWGGLNPGIYQMTVTDFNGCTLVQTITLDSLNPIAAFDLTSPQFTSDYEGTANVEVHFVNQSLYFADPLDPTADTTFFWNFNFDNIGWIISHDLFEEFDTTYTEGGTYTVCLVAINKNGCTDTACVDIIVYDPLEFKPVNVFTPDGDGINDEFTFYYTAVSVKIFHCLVVDRWGVEMAEFNDISSTWNGTDKNGDMCTDGVYFYIYEGEAENGDTFQGQGTVTIINSP